VVAAGGEAEPRGRARISPASDHCYALPLGSRPPHGCARPSSGCGRRTRRSVISTRSPRAKSPALGQASGASLVNWENEDGQFPKTIYDPSVRSTVWGSRPEWLFSGDNSRPDLTAVLAAECIFSRLRVLNKDSARDNRRDYHLGTRKRCAADHPSSEPPGGTTPACPTSTATPSRNRRSQTGRQQNEKLDPSTPITEAAC
jgi:hypothetical protein